MTNIKKAPKKAEPKNTQNTKETVGVLGLGIMGSAISSNLLAAGFDVIGFDPDLRIRPEQAVDADVRRIANGVQNVMGFHGVSVMW